MPWAHGISKNNVNGVEVMALSKVHSRGRASVTAPGGVSFRVVSPTTLALVGVSASDRSTLRHLLGGLDRPTSGSMHVRW